VRTSSFSNREVIDLVSQYFVPVWVSRDDYGLEKKAGGERDEWLRIQSTAGRRGLSNGNVSVYLIDPEGIPFDSLIVSKAAVSENLLGLLKKAIQERNLQPRRPEAITATRKDRQLQLQAKTEGGLVVHVMTRFLTGEVDKGVGEDWVELTRAEWQTLIPEKAVVGHSWKAGGKAVEKLAQYFYPPLCEYNAASSKVNTAMLTATVSAVTTKEVQVSLQGEVELDHSRDGSNPGRVQAQLVGLITYDPQQKTITTLRMASDRATYVWNWQGNPNPSRIGIWVESGAVPQQHKKN